MRVITTSKAVAVAVTGVLFGALVGVVVPGLSTLWLLEAFGVSLSLLLLLFAVDARSERQKNEQSARRRDELSALLLEGQTLNQRLTATNEPLETLEPDMETWATKTETWLTQDLGISYLARFRNSAGIPIGNFVMRRSLNTREGPLNGFMRVRLARLGEFLTELAQRSTAE